MQCLVCTDDGCTHLQGVVDFIAAISVGWMHMWSLAQVRE